MEKSRKGAKSIGMVLHPFLLFYLVLGMAPQLPGIILANHKVLRAGIMQAARLIRRQRLRLAADSVIMVQCPQSRHDIPEK